MLKEVPQNELVEKTIIGLALFYGNKFLRMDNYLD